MKTAEENKHIKKWEHKPEAKFNKKKLPTRTLLVILELMPYSPSLIETTSHLGLRKATVLIPTKEPHHVVISMIGEALASPAREAVSLYQSPRVLIWSIF